ncbi:MAG TPA: cupredoxin domain-containing protein [Thermomicrobiales bacterium]|nr:cupredoxin domain-containing protein [Thermomicrobiales bacterium]
MERPARLLAVLAVLSMILFAHPAAIAQDATPAAGEVIDPAECQVEPRAIEQIEQLMGTAGEEAEATPAAAQAGSMEGEEADEATVQAVTQTYRELVACLNAGEFLRIYALYTDNYLRRTLNDGGIDLQQIQATPAPDRQEMTALVGVSDVRQLAGGRVAARVETTSSPEGTASIIQAILEPVDDRLLIADETVVDAAAATPAAGGEEQAAAGGGAGESVTVESYDIYFEPDELSIPADTDVTIQLPNEGVTLHNFSIDELGISVDIAPGATEETVINAPAGTYEFYCNVPGHKPAGMVGTLTVQ